MKRQPRGSRSGIGPGGAPTDTTSPAAAADPGFTSTDDQGGAELLEDRSIRISGGRHGRRAGLSVPGAIVGTFLVAALALGAAGPISSALTGAGSDGAGHESGLDKTGTGGHESTDGTDGADGAGTAEHDGAPDGEQPDASEPGDGTDGTGDGTDGATDGSTDGGTDGATEGTDGTSDGSTDGDPTKPDSGESAPDATGIEIGLGIDGTAVAVEWSRCDVDGFVAYKIIRSSDSYATWPLGAGDTVVGVVEDPGVLRFVDRTVAGGREYHYKVVALRLFNTEKVVACRSDAKGIETPQPTPKPDPTDGGNVAIGLAVTIKESHPFIDWTACEGVDFQYYKVVRSTDSTVTFPPGDNDTKVAAVAKGGETKAFDGDAPGGKTLWYRVFCVRESDAGWVVVGSSDAKAVETPETPPAPDPKALGFEAGLTDGGAVALSWQGCAIDGFAYYKVVRSTTTENPSYFPWTDGTELIGVIETQDTTDFVDTNVASGQTIYYRIQCLGYWYGEKTLRGQTTVIAVTIP